jgi:hypothetical protein
MSQTSINAGGQRVGYAGDPADPGPKDSLSGFNADTTQMPFGYGVSVNTNTGDKYSLPTGMTNAYPVAGVLLRRANYVLQHNLAGGGSAGDLGGSGLLQYAPLNVGIKGRFLLPVEVAVSRGDRLWCRGVATGTAITSAAQGSWRGAAVGAVPLGGTVAAGASYFIDCTKQGVFRTASYTSADGTTLVAVCEVDFTNGAAI